MRTRLPPALIAAAIATAARGQVVIDMPPPPAVTHAAPAAPDRSAATAPRTTYEQHVADRESPREIDAGDLALARYARARSGPSYTSGPAGPYGGYVAGYGYYPYLGYYAGWGWGGSGRWGGWGWGGRGWWAVPCFSGCGVRCSPK
jgi:hypothetical protein